MRVLPVLLLLFICQHIAAQETPCAFTGKNSLKDKFQKEVILGLKYGTMNYMNHWDNIRHFPFFGSIGVGVNYQVTKRPKIKLESRIMYSGEKINGGWAPPISCFVYPAKIDSKYLLFPLMTKFYFSSKDSKKIQANIFGGVNPVLLAARELTKYDWNDVEVECTHYSIFKKNNEYPKYQIGAVGGFALEFKTKGLIWSPYIEYSMRTRKGYGVRHIGWYNINYLSAGIGLFL